MLKEEFEARIGKEVSFDTFRLYEAMYNSLPEKYTKDDFVHMLNISAIPESAEAVQRRENAEAIRKEWREHITSIDFDIISCKNAITRYTEYASEDKKTALYWKNCIKSKREYIRKLQAEKREYKTLLG